MKLVKAIMLAVLLMLVFSASVYAGDGLIEGTFVTADMFMPINMAPTGAGPLAYFPVDALNQSQNAEIGAMSVHTGDARFSGNFANVVYRPNPKSGYRFTHLSASSNNWSLGDGTTSASGHFSEVTGAWKVSDKVQAGITIAFNEKTGTKYSWPGGSYDDGYEEYTWEGGENRSRTKAGTDYRVEARYIVSPQTNASIVYHKRTTDSRLDTFPGDDDYILEPMTMSGEGTAITVAGRHAWKKTKAIVGFRGVENKGMWIGQTSTLQTFAGLQVQAADNLHVNVGSFDGGREISAKWDINKNFALRGGLSHNSFISDDPHDVSSSWISASYKKQF